MICDDLVFYRCDKYNRSRRITTNSIGLLNLKFIRFHSFEIEGIIWQIIGKCYLVCFCLRDLPKEYKRCWRCRGGDRTWRYYNLLVDRKIYQTRWIVCMIIPCKFDRESIRLIIASDSA
jgi:hypothetical protein